MIKTSNVPIFFTWQLSMTNKFIQGYFLPQEDILNSKISKYFYKKNAT